MTVLDPEIFVFPNSRISSDVREALVRTFKVHRPQVINRKMQIGPLRVALVSKMSEVNAVIDISPVTPKGKKGRSKKLITGMYTFAGVPGPRRILK